MRITIVQGAFLPVPPLRGGAVEKVWFELGKEFVRRGHSVTHISRRCDGLPAQENIEGVSHLRVVGYDAPASLLQLKRLDLLYTLRVRRLLPPADILITNTFWLPMLVRSTRYGVLYVHVARYPKGQMRFYRHATRLQTVSTPIGEAIRQEVPECASQIRVIPYPIPYPLPECPDWSAERNPWILYVGRIHPEKGIELLLNAFRSLRSGGMKDYRLVFVGPWETKYGGGGEDYYRSLRNQFRQEEEYIDWVGPVFETERLTEFYKKASLFVYPSLAEHGETFGLAPLEAMAFGCPPVVSSLQCFADFIEDDGNGFIFDHRAAKPESGLALRLTTLLKTPQRIMSARKAGLQSVKQFTLEEIARQYLKDFEVVTKRSRISED